MTSFPPGVLKSVEHIRASVKLRPYIAVILGSGLGGFADSLENKESILTADIPLYPRSTVEGHKGRLVFGTIAKQPVMAFQGRVHYYESGSAGTILHPIQVARAFGISILIITNAAGGINRSFRPGDLMLITDQINLTMMRYDDGIAKPDSKFHPVYDSALNRTAQEEAIRRGITLRQGVYCGVKGPSYETAAEVEMIRRIGGDAVGMSTVNEASLAASLGMRIIGISCITNLATGILNVRLSHDEVTEVADRVKSSFASLLTALVTRIAIDP
jgi:purine-nucleoside phosphorylase